MNYFTVLPMSNRKKSPVLRFSNTRRQQIYGFLLARTGLDFLEGRRTKSKARTI